MQTRPCLRSKRRLRSQLNWPSRTTWSLTLIMPLQQTNWPTRPILPCITTTSRVDIKAFLSSRKLLSTTISRKAPSLGSSAVWAYAPSLSIWVATSVAPPSTIRNPQQSTAQRQILTKWWSRQLMLFSRPWATKTIIVSRRLTTWRTWTVSSGITTFPPHTS